MADRTVKRFLDAPGTPSPVAIALHVTTGLIVAALIAYAVL
ncbi:hypothetical protein [Pseudomonas sp. PA15(2017)]|nr:hypothetical protein [Pseudomonas sp. PA15(2017)]